MSAVELVLAYVAASQQARSSGDPADFAAVRNYLADDIVISVAAPWTDAPWRVAAQGADAVVTRLSASANAGAILRTETVNAVEAGDDVLIEQVSTITMSDGEHISAVCFLFSVREGKISACRTYRNDAGLPQP